MKAILFDPFSALQATMTTACLIDLGAIAGKVKGYGTAADVDVEVTRQQKRASLANLGHVTVKKDGSLKTF